MAYDGSIIFCTKMDTDGFEKGVKSLSSKSLELVNKIKKTENEIKLLKQELKELAESPVKSEVLESLERQADKAKQKLNELYAEADKIADSKISGLKETGFSLTDESIDNLLAQDKEWVKIQSDIDKAEQKLQSYENELKSVVSATQNMKGTDTAEYKTKSAKLDELCGKLNVYKAKLNETESAEKNSTKSIDKYKAALSSTIKGLEKFCSVLGRVGKKIYSAIKTGTLGFINKIGEDAKGSSKQLNLLGKSLNRIKQILLSVVVYKGIRSMFNSIGDSFKDIASYSPKFNNTMSVLVSAFEKLKNTIATAVVPLINFAAPLLTSFMNILTNAIDKTAQFFAVITGNSSYTKSPCRETAPR